MKKVLFMLLVTGLISFTSKSYASEWEYCKYANQIGPVSWDLYVNKTLIGGGIPAGRIEFRIKQFSPSQQMWITTNWATLPTSGFVGNSSPAGGISTIEIREVQYSFDLGAWIVTRQLFVTDDC